MASPNAPPVRSRKLPCVVHMWFENGEGWAYDSKFRQAIRDVVESLDGILKSSADTEQFVIPFQRGCLVGEKIPDVECKDPRAAQRRPFIIRAAFFPEKSPSTEEVSALRTELSKLDPATQGDCGALQVALEQRVLEPLPKSNDAGAVAPVQPGPGNLPWAYPNVEVPTLLAMDSDPYERERFWQRQFNISANQLHSATMALKFCLCVGMAGVIAVGGAFLLNLVQGNGIAVPGWISLCLISTVILVVIASALGLVNSQRH